MELIRDSWPCSLQILYVNQCICNRLLQEFHYSIIKPYFRPGVKLSGITSQICTTKYRHDLFLLQRYPVSYRVAICYFIILYQMFGCTYYLCYIIQGMLLSTILYECFKLECTGKNYYKYIYVTIHYMAT